VENSLIPSTDRILSLIKAADKPKPKPEAVAALHQLLDQYPEMWRAVCNLAENARSSMIAQTQATPAMSEAIKANMKELATQLGADKAPAIERLVIEEIMLAWLDEQITRMGHAQNSRNMTLTQAEFWQRRLTLTQRRYLRAVESLARIRKMNITIQLNVAASGGQQVNVAGNVENHR